MLKHSLDPRCLTDIEGLGKPSAQIGSFEATWYIDHGPRSSGISEVGLSPIAPALHVC
jgi:hypothetical protein